MDEGLYDLAGVGDSGEESHYVWENGRCACGLKVECQHVLFVFPFLSHNHLIVFFVEDYRGDGVAGVCEKKVVVFVSHCVEDVE